MRGHVWPTIQFSSVALQLGSVGSDSQMPPRASLASTLHRDPEIRITSHRPPRTHLLAQPARAAGRAGGQQCHACGPGPGPGPGWGVRCVGRTAQSARTNAPTQPGFARSTLPRHPPRQRQRGRPPCWCRPPPAAALSQQRLRLPFRAPPACAVNQHVRTRTPPASPRARNRFTSPPTAPAPAPAQHSTAQRGTQLTARRTHPLAPASSILLCACFCFPSARTTSTQRYSPSRLRT